MPAASWRIMPARSISRWEAISASFGVSRRLGRKNRERRMESRKYLAAAVKPEPARKYKGAIFLLSEVGSLVTIARKSTTNAFTQSRNRHLVHEISGKRSKSWEDTRTRNATSLPRCGSLKIKQVRGTQGCR